MTGKLQTETADSITYVKGDLFVLGSESRDVHDRGWIGEQQTGDRNVVAFSFVPVQVRFGSSDPVVLGPTTLALTNPRCPYTRSALSSSGQRTIFLSMDSSIARELIQLHDPFAADSDHDLFPTRHAPSSTQATALIRRFEQCATEPDSSIDQMEFDEISLGIIQHALDGVYEFIDSRPIHSATGPTLRAQRDWVDYAMTLMSEFPERRWSLISLADEVDLSPGYLSRLFRVHTGRTLSQTLKVIRLVRILDRLPYMRGEQLALALDAGFSSHAHMSTAFKSVFGITPSQWIDSGSRDLREWASNTSWQH
ncbi:MAG: helix-turn-helix transcriptional regulator [Phycisphaerales bacterium]|nr:helix-turn-helix transcriptional regulator [Phycisphaerales bacterium]